MTSGPRRVAIVHFDVAGEPLDAEVLDVDAGSPTPVHFILTFLRYLDHWPVGSVSAKGFYDKLTPPVLVDVPRRGRQSIATPQQFHRESQRDKS